MEINKQIKAITKAIDKLQDSLCRIESVGVHYYENENKQVPKSLRYAIRSVDRSVDSLFSFRECLIKLQEGQINGNKQTH